MKKKLATLLSITMFLISPLFATYPKVAVVLSGGGAKGFAEIAAVEEIQKLGIPIDFICGTSMGALIGGYYAAGYSSEEIKRMIESYDMAAMLLTPPYLEDDKLPGVFEDEMNSFYTFGFSSKGVGDVPGLVGDQLIQQFFSRTLIKNSNAMDFKDLSIPYKAVTTNVTSSEKVILDSGLLQDAMRASMSLPLVFPPYILLDGTYTMDGGLKDNFPVSLAREWGADIIIAVNVSSDGLKEPDGYSTLSGVSIQLISLVTFADAGHFLGDDDLLLTPKVNDFTILEMGKYDDILQRGYEAVFENRDKLLKIRDKISQTRDLVPYNTVGTYSQLPDPVVKEVRIVDVTQNSESYSLATIFDEFIGKTLNDEALDELESDISRFNKINNIATTSYSFSPYDDRSENDGILYLYIRDWEKSPSRISISLDGFFGVSNNEENYSWANTHFDIAGIFANLNDSDIDAIVDLSFNDAITGEGEFNYNISSKDDILIDGVAGLSLTVGGISPVNSNYFKNRITSTGLQAAISLGSKFQYSNDLLIENKLVYNLSYLSPSTLPQTLVDNLSSSASSQIPYTEPFVTQLKFLFGGVYSKKDPTLLSTDGFLVNLNGMISNENNVMGYSGSLELRYSLPVSKRDTLKLNFNFRFKNSNPELLDSYYDIGTYRGMAGYSASTYRRAYMLIDFSYQKEVGRFIGPVFLQSGIKFLTYDSYNPFDNLYDEDAGTLMKYPSEDINIFNTADVGIYAGLGTKFDKATLLVGLGITARNNFALTVEFF